MTRELRVLPHAAADIEEQAFYYAVEAGPLVVLRFRTALNATLERLLRFPSMGSRRFGQLDLPRSMRAVRVDGFPSLRVVYRVGRHSIDAVRVIHTAREIGLEDFA